MLKTVHHKLIATAAIVALSLLSAGSPHQAQEKKSPRNDKPAPEKKPAAEPEALRLHSNLVLLGVTVTGADGKYIRGLSANDFTVLEDSASQAVAALLTEESPFAAAILIDVSSSMEYKLSLVRGAAASFLDHIREDDQVAIYGFGTEVNLLKDFSNLRDVGDKVWEAEVEKYTRLYDCMNEALDKLAAREEKKRALLVISDGVDSLSKASRESVLKKALAAGVVIYTVDLMDDHMLAGTASHVMPLRMGRQYLQEFANQSGGRYLHSPQGNALESTFTNIVDELRNQYTLTYYSSNDKRDGRWRKLSVALSRAGLTVRTRRGYYAPKD